MKTAVFDLRGDRALGSVGFPMACFQQFWEVTKGDILAFVKDFHLRCRLSKHIGASFTTLIPKKKGASCLKEDSSAFAEVCIRSLLRS